MRAASAQPAVSDENADRALDSQRVPRASQGDGSSGVRLNAVGAF